jgi:hypothetical protein
MCYFMTITKGFKPEYKIISDLYCLINQQVHDVTKEFDLVKSVLYVLY